MTSIPKLYSYFRSSCSWRVRAALAIKEIEYETEAIHLVKGEQGSSEFLKINPLGQVPALEIDGHTIFQSIPIMEYLEETRPQKRILPLEPAQRAKVREICEMINSGIQPLQNLSVISLHSEDSEERIKWAAHWIQKGFVALEKVLAQSSGKYCVGDEITMADCCLLPQVYNASRFKVDMTSFPTINRINCSLLETEVLKKSHPFRQVDCPSDLRIP